MVFYSYELETQQLVQLLDAVRLLLSQSIENYHMGFLHAVFFSLENLNPQLRLEILNIDYTQNLFAEVGIEAMEVPARH